MPLTSENNFLPDLDAIPKHVLKRAKLLFINYPNNPTSACATTKFFEDVVSFAKENNIIVFHDAAYVSIYLDGLKKPSIFEIKDAKDVALEFHSLSKTYNMTGWRIGFCAGNKELIKNLGKFKSHIDSSLFGAIQEAGITAMSGPQSCVEETRRLIRKRRDIVLKALEKTGVKAKRPDATFYIWADVPKGYDSKSFAIHMLEKRGVVVTPGTGFGDAGEGYFRISLTCPDSRLEEAIARIEKGI
jgi:LL-diaminopimelate aminotransferase